MARWALSCHECDLEFTHSKILEHASSWTDPFIADMKPEFREGGESLRCPHCKAESVYLRHELLYRSAEDA